MNQRESWRAELRERGDQTWPVLYPLERELAVKSRAVESHSHSLQPCPETRPQPARCRPHTHPRPFRPPGSQNVVEEEWSVELLLPACLLMTSLMAMYSPVDGHDQALLQLPCDRREPAADGSVWKQPLYWCGLQALHLVSSD